MKNLSVTATPALFAWRETLGLDWDAELATLTLDPNAGRGRELAAMVRDHPDGGVDAVVECVAELATVMGFKPLADEALRRNIAALGPCSCGSWEPLVEGDREWPSCPSCGAI